MQQCCVHDLTSSYVIQGLSRHGTYAGFGSFDSAVCVIKNTDELYCLRCIGYFCVIKNTNEFYCLRYGKWTWSENEEDFLATSRRV
jgi:hypothetical protein